MCDQPVKIILVHIQYMQIYMLFFLLVSVKQYVPAHTLRLYPITVVLLYAALAVFQLPAITRT